MSSIKIRQATENDATAISALMAELGYQLSPADTKLRIRAYSTSSDTVLVAESESEVVAFVSLHVIPLFHAIGCLGRITAMCVSSSHQRQGVGRALLASLDEHASAKGCVRIEVTSGDSRMNDAHIFYQACGFLVDSRRFQKTLT